MAAIASVVLDFVGAGFAASVLATAIELALPVVAAVCRGAPLLDATFLVTAGAAGFAGARTVCTDLGTGGGGVDNQSSPIITLLTDTTRTTTYKINDILLPGINTLPVGNASKKPKFPLSPAAAGTRVPLNARHFYNALLCAALL